RALGRRAATVLAPAGRLGVGAGGRGHFGQGAGGGGGRAVGSRRAAGGGAGAQGLGRGLELRGAGGGTPRHGPARPRGRAPRGGGGRAVKEGLRTPSYRDAIQSAAISAVVDHPDSELVAAVEAIAGQQPLAAYGLAALAARGDAAARGALARLLEDRRAWVR